MCVYLFVCVPYMCSACAGQKRAPEALKLELNGAWEVPNRSLELSPIVLVINENSKQVLLTNEPSLHPMSIEFVKSIQSYFLKDWLPSRV